MSKIVRMGERCVVLLLVGKLVKPSRCFVVPSNPDPYAFQMLTENEPGCGARAGAHWNNPGSGYDARYAGRSNQLGPSAQSRSSGYSNDGFSEPGTRSYCKPEAQSHSFGRQPVSPVFQSPRLHRRQSERNPAV